jgi:hypothetical protein
MAIELLVTNDICDFDKSSGPLIKKGLDTP